MGKHEPRASQTLVRRALLMQNRTPGQGRGQARSRTQITRSGAVRAASLATELPHLSAVRCAFVSRPLATLGEDSDLCTPASCPGQADQTGSAGGCQKTRDPADRSSRRTARAASAESEVRPGPRPRPYARTTAKPWKQGRKHYPHSPCRIFACGSSADPSLACVQIIRLWRVVGLAGVHMVLPLRDKEGSNNGSDHDLMLSAQLRPQLRPHRP